MFFYKNHNGEHETCHVITPKSIFLEGVITGHHFWQYMLLYCLKPFSHFESSLVICLHYPNKYGRTKLNGINFNQEKYLFKNAKSRF